ncbi:MAG: S41 family peptidase [Elusimicrobia bacterium]|nr:S41 family peptidase [Elusimicrobiota bacterium]
MLILLVAAALSTVIPSASASGTARASAGRPAAARLPAGIAITAILPRLGLGGGSIPAQIHAPAPGQGMPAPAPPAVGEPFLAPPPTLAPGAQPVPAEGPPVLANSIPNPSETAGLSEKVDGIRARAQEAVLKHWPRPFAAGPVADDAPAIKEPEAAAAPTAEDFGRQAAQVAGKIIHAFYKPVPPETPLRAALEALSEASALGGGPPLPAPRIEDGALGPDPRQALREIETRIAEFAARLPTAVRSEDTLAAALKAMVAVLDDPYSMVLDRREADSALGRLVRGHAGFAGVGIAMTPDPERGFMLVHKALPGSPAEAAGILPGDRIVAVDGRGLEPGMTPEQRGLQGEAGSSVELLIERPGAAARTFAARMTRGYVKSPVSYFKLLPGSVGYLFIASFVTENTEEIFTNLSALLAAGAKSLVIDLRFNPGGDPQAARRLASRFLAPGQTVFFVASRFMEKDRSVSWREIPHAVVDAGRRLDLPLAVLVNGRSASASEIFAAAMQDHGRAAVFGARTFGKGSAQNVWELARGMAVDLTVSLWLTPNGRSIKKGSDGEGGVAPDPGRGISLEAPEEEALLQELRRQLLGFPPADPPLRDRALEAAASLLRSEAAR